MQNYCVRITLFDNTYGAINEESWLVGRFTVPAAYSINVAARRGAQRF
jgi:hypothetical protein